MPANALAVLLVRDSFPDTKLGFRCSAAAAPAVAAASHPPPPCFTACHVNGLAAAPAAAWCCAPSAPLLCACPRLSSGARPMDLPAS
jgi:hypothetical protein